MSTAGYQHEVDSGMITFLRVYLAVCGTIGCLGSVLNIIVVCVNKNLRTIPNAFLVNLSVADFIVCTFLIPMTMITYTMEVNSLFCRLVGYPNLTCLMVSVMSLGHVAVNRYVVICQSRNLYMKVYTKRNTIIMICGTWMMALLLYSPPFYGYGTYSRNDLFGACIFTSNDKDTYIFIFIFADSIVMFPTLAITGFSYTKILLKFRASRRKVEAMKPQTTATTPIAALSTRVETATSEISAVEETVDKSIATTTATTGGGTKKEKKKVSESDRKAKALVMNLIAIFLTFLLFWMPLVAIYKIDYYGSAPKELYHLLFAFAQSNSAANFIIYCSMNTQFRNAYKRLLTCGKYGNEI